MIEKNALTPDSDGKIHWFYELNLFTNPMVFFTLMKVFGDIVLEMSFLSVLLQTRKYPKKCRSS